MSRFANLDAPARHSSGAAHPPLPARHDRFSDRLSRRDQGRGRSGCSQHPALCRRVGLHAGRQPSARRGGVGADAARHRRSAGDVAGAGARTARLGDRCRRAFAGRPGSPLCRRRCRNRPDPSGRRLAFGFTRRARPGGRRARSISIRAWRKPPNAMPSRCSASTKAMSCSRRQSCSSPMGSAMG